MGDLKQGSNPHIRATVWIRGETFKAESETADLWQPKWNENQTVLAAAIPTPDREAGLLEGIAAGSWSVGIVEQSKGEGFCWLWRDRQRGPELKEEIMAGNAVEESQAALEPRWYCWVMHRGWSHHHSISLPTSQHPQTSNREAGPSRSWPVEQQSRTSSRVPL